jgi:hypothetical protein
MAKLRNIMKKYYANTEPSLTSTCKEGAETTGADTNLSDNTSKSVQQPKSKFFEDPINNHRIIMKILDKKVEDIVRS